MTRLIAFFILLNTCVSVFAREYVLVPNLTFVEKRGDLYHDITQPITGTCANIDFHWFDIYVLSGSTWVSFGSISKPSEWTRTYQFYQNERLLSTHRSRYNFGSIFDAAKTFEVVGSDLTPIGYIDGNFFSKQAAEFYFYDDKSQLFAIAHLDDNWSNLVIENLDGQPICVCKKLFHYNFHRYDLFSYISPQEASSTPNQYKWLITTNDDQVFDSRFFWPFMSFISEVWWAGQTL